LHIFKTESGIGGYKKLPPGNNFGRKRKQIQMYGATFKLRRQKERPKGCLTGALTSQLDSQGSIIRTSAKAIDENVIQGLQVWQLAQEGDHVRGGADVAKFAQKPGHREDNSLVLEVLFLELVDLVIGVMDNR